MRPLTDWPLADRRQLLGIFTDIDDTLTTNGAITPDALQALADLKAAGLRVIPITGRPLGWSEPMACGNLAQGLAPWPVDALVAENGAAAFVPNRAHPDRPPLKIFQQDADTRALNYRRLQAVAQQVLREVPGTRLSQDSAGRETDIAIDHSEFTQLAPDKIASVIGLMQAAGLQASVSSIHINGWIGKHNKRDGARWIVRELFGRTLDFELAQWAFIGDSTNDQLMFTHFAHSVGVANVRHFEAQLKPPPRYITPGLRGAGFTEMAHAIISAKI